MPVFDTTARSRARIHIANEHEGPVAFAAAELQRYLQRMTGAHVRITLDGFEEQPFGSRYILLHGLWLKRGAAPSVGYTSNENPRNSDPRIGRARVDL